MMTPALRGSILCIAATMLSACAAARQPLGPLVARGELGQAREVVIARLPDDRSHRTYLLDRMALAVLTLADGYPAASQALFEETYDILRTQGINADKTVASAVLNEDLKFWKGEPFEQALAMFYYGLQQAELDQWDNVRAAAQSALFNLRDFGKAVGEERGRIDSQAIFARAVEYECAASSGRTPPDRSDFLNSGYAVRQSNFTLGYILAGLASTQLGRPREAADFFAVAVDLDSRLTDILRELRDGRYNSVLVVSYGLGPAKVAYGPDNALVRFSALTPSDDAPLSVWLDGPAGGAAGRTVPAACDVNRMAADHMWNSLEDVRQLKSLLGSGLLYGGIIAAGVGADRGSREAVYGGLAAMAAGAFLKAGAHADTRYCDAYPQRFYIVPLNISAGQNVVLQVEGKPQSRLVLAALNPPAHDRGQSPVQLRYVRLPMQSTVGVDAPPPWAVSGHVSYASDSAPLAAGSAALPYILGGRCVRLPSAAAMDRYHRAGQLTGVSYVEYESLCRAEGLVLEPEEVGGRVGRHVLEGGNVLFAPLAGTLGFARLYGQEHPPYQPRSEALRQFTQALRGSAMTTISKGGTQP